jgi:hypothetical protein
VCDQNQDQAAAGRLTALAGTLRLQSEQLDDLVRDVFSGRAADVNNGGLESQIACLVDAYGAVRVDAMLHAAAEAAEGTAACN